MNYEKKYVSMILTTILLFNIYGNVEAYSSFDNTKNNQYDQYYDETLIDWDNIDNIEVIYIDGEDEFINDAIKRGIPVSFKNNHTPILTNNLNTINYGVTYSSFTYFTSISWISRDGKLSLSLNPKSPYTIDKDKSWQEAVRFFQYHPMYREEQNPSKYMSMYNQYGCHVDYARGFKTPWNIEPWKEDKGYWGFVLNGCN